MDSAGIGKGVLIGALGTVAGGLALTALSWLFGFHHAVWLWIVSTAGSIGRALVFPVSLPVWGIAVFVAAFFGLLFAWRFRHSQNIAPRAALDTQAPLTQHETDVISILVASETAWLSMHDIVTHGGAHRLCTEQAVDRLVKRGILEISQSGQLYRLSALGRDYAIAEGYVGNPISKTARYLF